ncbi:general substrate transporter [Aspergillus pseudodeflectus]|uniref:General substrate transporter n=1 Tax=Aspergillus pseudodeflectus TaxID=176178 RepID=A0ABR4JF64_9EURO
MTSAAPESKHDVATVEADNLKTHVEDIGYLVNQELHEETVRQAFTRYPKRTFWIIYAVWVLVISGFDSTASSAVIGIPRFRMDYGFEYGGNYVLPAQWQAAFSGGPAAGGILSAVGASLLSDRIGRKYIYLIGLIFIFVGITLETVSNGSCAVFFGGKFLAGMATGCFVTTSMTYVAEFSPVAIRGIVSAAAPISGSASQLVVALIQNGYGDLPNSWAYKSLFMSQYAVTFTALIFWPFLPESAWYLVRRGKEDQAATTFRSFGLPETEIEKAIANIKLTEERNKAETEGVSYAECFRKSNLRRTILAIGPFTIQAFCGILFIVGYMVYYIQLAGYSTAMSYRLNITAQVIACTGNFCSWFLIDRVGRRNLMLCGLGLLCILLWITGGLAVAATPGSIKGTVALILLFSGIYNATIGAASYTMLAEIATPRLRSKTVSIAVVSQSSWDIMWAFVMPYIFNPDKGNLQAKTTFIFGGFAIICWTYLYIFHPETKGRSYQELDEMFTKRVSAKQFRNYVTETEQRGADAKRQADESNQSV